MMKSSITYKDFTMQKKAWQYLKRKSIMYIILIYKFIKSCVYARLVA